MAAQQNHSRKTFIYSRDYKNAYRFLFSYFANKSKLLKFHFPTFIH